METTMFALGVLAMIIVMLITVVVVGIVKVFRMNRQIKNLYTYIHEVEIAQTNGMDRFESRVDSRLQDVYRDVNMVESTIRNGMDHFERAVNDQITDAVTVGNSYTDKRIDKLIDTYFEVKEAEKSSKKLIKG